MDVESTSPARPAGRFRRAALSRGGTLLCLGCGFENPADHRYCGECGDRLIKYCVACGRPSALRMKFCGDCGVTLPVWTPAAAAPPAPTVHVQPTALPLPPAIVASAIAPPVPPAPAAAPSPPPPAAPSPPLAAAPVPPAPAVAPSPPLAAAPAAAPAAPPVAPAAPAASAPPSPPLGTPGAAAPTPATLPTSAAAPRPSSTEEADRRTVTVFFADVSGSTAMAEKMDPEDLTAIMNDCFAQLGACIVRYEGTIDKYIGDAVMALFGAPIAHENDPERAIMAGLDMQETLRRFSARLERDTGFILRMRIGINTGEVIAGGVGGESKVDYTVMGDAVNVASRLEHAAPVGSILVSHATYVATQGMFEWRILDPITVKGKAEPLKVYEPLRRSRERGGVRGVGRLGLESPFFGRDEQLAAAVNCFQRATARQPQVLCFVGDAGLGKSRLRHEFNAWIEREGWLSKTLQLIGRCLPYSQGNSYGVIQSLLRNYLRIEDDDALEVVRHKLAERVADAEAARLLLPILVGSDLDGTIAFLDPDRWRKQAMLALRDLIEAEARARPVVFYFEDLHWIDPSSLAMLNYLVAEVKELPVLFYLIYRGDLVEPAEWTAHGGFHRVALQPLTPEQVGLLLGALMPTLDLPHRLRDLIAERSAGNPFYVEEIIKSFVDTGAIVRDGDTWRVGAGIDQATVPDNVQAIIMTRIDRLDDAAKRLLQQASVIGRRVSRAMLAEVAGEVPEAALGVLAGHDLLMPSAEREPLLLFKNLLTQQVAYNSLLVRRRRDLHRKVGAALEHRHADSLDAAVDDLARHFFAGEVWPKAVDYNRRAGKRARALFANAEATRAYDQCTEALARLEKAGDPAVTPEAVAAIRSEVLAERADIRVILGDYDRALADYEAALELAATPERRAEILWRIGDGIHERRAKYDLALACFGRAAAELGEDAPMSAVRGRIGTSTAKVYMRQSQLEQAKAFALECIAQLEGTDYQLELAGALRQLGNIFYFQSDWSGAIAYWERSLAAAERTGDPREQVLPHSNLGAVFYKLGRYDEAATHFQAGLQLAEKIGDVWLISVGWSNIGACARVRGDYDAAVGHYQRSIRIKERLGDRRGLVTVLMNLAEVHREAGDPARALELLQRSLGLAHETQNAAFMPEITRQLAACYLDLDQVDEAERVAGEARILAREKKDRLEDARATRILGEVALRRGDLAAAEAQVGEALSQVRELKSDHEIALALLSLAAVHAARGDGVAARPLLDEAGVLLGRVGTPPEREQHRRLLADLAAPTGRSSP